MLKGVLLCGAPPGFAEAGSMYSQRKRLRILSLAFFQSLNAGLILTWPEGCLGFPSLWIKESLMGYAPS